MEVEDKFFAPGRKLASLKNQCKRAALKHGHKYKCFACIRHRLEGVMVERIE